MRTEEYITIWKVTTNEGNGGRGFHVYIETTKIDDAIEIYRNEYLNWQGKPNNIIGVERYLTTKRRTS